EPIIDERKINPRLTLQLDPEQVEDDEHPANAILEAAPGQRVFHLKKDAQLTLTRMTLRDGDVTALAEPDGGLVFAEGIVTLQHARLENGRAANGGAVYLA